MDKSTMTDTDGPLAKLRQYLKNLPRGAVREQHGKVEGLLAHCWEEFSGWGEAGMDAYKLAGRTEAMTWEPPNLSFTIERHGPTVMGSTRADLHRWTVDIEAGRAECNRWYGRRQLADMAKPIRIAPLAQELATAILKGRPDPRLKWSPDGRKVRVNLSKSVQKPETDSRQTIASRGSRLRDALLAIMTAAGWAKAGNRGAAFSRPSVDDAPT